MEQKHYYYIDYMRIFAMSCVVFMHAASASLRRNLLSADWMALNVVTSLAFCAVPLFFMISGQLMLSSEKTARVGYVMKKRIPKLVIPLVVYSAVAAGWLAYVETETFIVREWLKILKSGLGEPVMVHFWFMYTLIGMYLISPVLYGGLHSLSARGRAWLGLVLFLGMSMATVRLLAPQGIGSFVPYQIVEELWFFNGHMYALLIGWLLSRIQRRIPNLLLIGVAVLDLGTIIWGTRWMTQQWGNYVDVFQSQNHGMEILLAMCIFLLCKQNLNRPFGKLNALVKPLANLAFPIYLLHNVMISVLYFYELPHERALDVGIATILVIVICYFIIKTLSTIRPLCYLVTGMSYKEACNSCNWIYTVNLFRGA